MVAAANLVEVAALVGDTCCERRCLTPYGRPVAAATELAYCAHVSRSTASATEQLVAAGS